MAEFTNTTEAKSAGVKITGDPDAWSLICKASMKGPHGWNKSTKRMEVPGGWLYQVTTDYLGGDGETVTSCAEALAFVPDNSQ